MIPATDKWKAPRPKREVSEKRASLSGASVLAMAAAEILKANERYENEQEK
jgi:hypothetical protein